MPKPRKPEPRSAAGASPRAAQQAVPIPGLSFRIILSLVIVAGLAAVTIARNEVWRSEMALWDDTVRKSPNKGRAHHNLGRIYDRKGYFDEAFAQYQAAVAADPTIARAHESLGISYVSRNQFALAQRELEAALRLDPHLVDARTFLQYIGGQENRAQ